MARIQQSIDIGVPVHVVYNQLIQFEDYPRFMQEVETVHRLDDTHLHWSAKMSYQPLEWDSEIVEQIPDQRIAWRNAGGPMQSGKVEVQPVGDDMARVTMTLECDPDQVPAERFGNPVKMIALRLEDDLARFKSFLEERANEGGAKDTTQAAGENMGKTVGRTAEEQHDSGRSSSPAGARRCSEARSRSPRSHRLRTTPETAVSRSRRSRTSTSNPIRRGAWGKCRWISVRLRRAKPIRPRPWVNR